MSVVRLAIGVVLLGCLLRAFVALGLITPLVVIGDSMAPRIADGDSLLVDRASPSWRRLDRWDRVASYSPEDARQLVVKRIVGLPGERVWFRGGDLVIDGEVVRKSLTEQRALRLLVHRESVTASRWIAEAPRSAKQTKGSWKLDASHVAQVIRYQHPGDGVIRDGLEINKTISRRLNPVADLMLTFDVRMDRQAACQIEIVVAGRAASFHLAASDCRLTIDRQEPLARDLPPVGDDAWRRITFSLFDQQALAAIGEEPIIGSPLAPAGRIAEPQRVSVRASGGAVDLGNLTLWRDVHYERRPIDLAPADAAGGWRLGPDRWFLVGDNQAISLDSRSWRVEGAGVPRRLILGRVAGD